VDSQVGCGGVPNIIVVHDNISALYGFSTGSPVNKPVNSLLFFNKGGKIARFVLKKKLGMEMPLKPLDKQS
jgi:hypothetical protein